MDKKTLKEFERFLKSNEAPPKASSTHLFSRIEKDLYPSILKVFTKLAFIQFGLGMITLIFCPQLGVGPLIGEAGIMKFFMHFGPSVCAGVCGLFYFGTSVMGASLLLRPEELRTLKHRHLVGIPLLSTLSLVILMLLGASAPPFIWAIWLGGALLGGEIGSQIVFSARIRKLPA